MLLKVRFFVDFDSFRAHQLFCFQRLFAREWANVVKKLLRDVTRFPAVARRCPLESMSLSGDTALIYSSKVKVQSTFEGLSLRVAI